MLLSELLEGLTFTVTAGNTDKTVDPASVEIKDVVNDNRKIAEGSLFLCIQGANFDGHSCAAEASEKKAGAIVVCHDVELPEGCEMPVVYSCGRYKICDGIYFCGLLRTSRKEA